MNVGILIGDFQLQRRLAGGVVGQRAPHIGAIEQCLPPDFRRGQVARKSFAAVERRISSRRAPATATPSAPARCGTRLVELPDAHPAAPIAWFPASRAPGSLQNWKFARGEIALQAAARRCFAPHSCLRQQRFIFARGVKSQATRRGLGCASANAAEIKFQRAASARCSASAMRLPRLPAVSIGTSKVTGTIHGVAIVGNLACHKPAYRYGRIRAFARGDFGGLRRGPIRPRLGERRLIIKRDERQCVQIPRFPRPFTDDAVGFQKRVKFSFVSERASKAAAVFSGEIGCE